MAQSFRTKREFLIWYGKSPDDRRLVDRLMLRGEIRMENGMYIYESKEDMILGLEKKVKELEREIENLKQERDRNDTQVMNKNDNQTSDSDLIDHIRYLYIRNEMREECIKNLIRMYYNKNTQAGWEEAEKKTYQLIGFEVDPDEGAELEYIKSII